MARINQKVEFRGTKGKWAGVLATPQDDKGTYAFLMLFKPSVVENISPAGGSEVSGYAVTAPTGSGWRKKPDGEGEVYENQVTPASKIDPGTFYRAGFSAAPAAALRDRNEFLAFVKRAIKERSDTSRAMSAQDDFAKREAHGLWLVEYSLRRDGWKDASPDSHDAATSRLRILYAFDPGHPQRVAAVWYAWHGVTFDENRFNAEAAAFLGSLRQTTP